MSHLWNLILVTPILNVLVYFYQLTGNLGISIILLTVAVRTILLPFVLPSMKSMNKQKELQPEIQKLKKKYGTDKQLLAKKQMELLKEHGVNPASGCLTQVVMIIVLIALFNVIRLMSVNPDIANINSMLYIPSFAFENKEAIKTSFLYMDLSKSDPYYVLAILSGLSQYVLTKLTAPLAKMGKEAAEETKDKSDDFAYEVQNQMLLMMPVMNAIVALTLPSGVALYIVIGTLYSLAQQYALMHAEKIKSWIKVIKFGKR